MTRQLGVLPLSPVAIADESLPGFVLRLVALYRRSKARDLGMAIATPGCAFRIDDIRTLAARCGESLDTLVRLSYLPTMSGQRVQFQNIEVPRGLIRLSSGRRYCPVCLAVSPHHRALWDLGIATACPEHHTLLEERCPRCGRRPGWQYGQILFCSCRHDLRDAPRRGAGDRDEPWREELADLVAGRLPESLSHINGEPSDLLHLAITLGLQLAPHWTGPRRIRDVPNHPPDQIDGIMQAGLAAARRWPDSMSDIVEHYRRQSRSGVRQYGVAKELGDYLAAWVRDLPDLDFAGTIRKAIFDYFAAEPIIQFELGRSRALRGLGERQSTPFVTHQNGAAVLRCSYETLARLRADGAISAAPGRGKGIPTAVERRHVEARLSQIHGLTLREAAARLGVARPRTRELMQAGLIRELPRDSGRRAARVIDPASLNALVSAIECQLHPAGTRKKQIESARAANLLKSAGLAYPDFIQAARDGKLRPAAIDCKVRGLPAIRFLRDDVLCLAREMRDVAPIVPVSSAARILGLKWEVVDHLIHCSLLQIVGSGPRRARMIAKGVIDQFAQSHRTGAALAKWMGVSPRRVAELLAARGVKPISGPGQDGCRQNIYAVADLARAFPSDFVAPIRRE